MREERIFKFPVTCFVSGIDCEGEKFREQTKIYKINSQRASFWLNSRVTIDSKLHLTLDIPATFALEKRLKLFIYGKVFLIRSNPKNGKMQLVFTRLENKYKIEQI